MQNNSAETSVCVTSFGQRGFRPRRYTAFDSVIDTCKALTGLRSPSALMTLAQYRTGLDDFGEQSFLPSLEVLMESYAKEAGLSSVGRIAGQWDILRFLSNLLRLRDAEKQDPSLLEEEIRQPIFITGMPRSGTSLLHGLLAQDPLNRVVRCWETIYPYPLSARWGMADSRAAKVDRHLAAFAKLAPEIRRVHPIDAYSPQECTEITAHIFASLRFDTTHRVPSYRAWLDRAGHIAPYRFHRRFLTHLQHGKPLARWILKCPDHVFALGAIRAVYPDARFIFLHRDPVEILPSVAHLTQVLRRPFTRFLDKREIGAQVIERWAEGARILVNEAAESDSQAHRSIHLQFRAFLEDPMRTIERIYERFGCAFSSDSAARLRQRLVIDMSGSDRRKKSCLQDYGLDEHQVRQHFKDYISCFGF